MYADDFSASWLLAVAALAIAGFTLRKPVAALIVFLSVLPLFAHKAASAWGRSLLVLCTVFLVAYALRHLRQSRSAPAVVAGNRILSLSALYVAAGVLSLSSLPLLAMVQQQAAALAAIPASAWSHYLAGLLTVADTSREYSVLSVAQTAEAFVLCLIVWREARRSPAFIPRAGLAMSLGLAVFVGLGLLDFVGVVSLRDWRGRWGVHFDPRFVRLQSLAGNPGWFSQQVAYTLPFAIVLLVPGRFRRARIAGFAALLTAAGLALVLSFQRGSWITGVGVLLFLGVASARDALRPQHPRDRSTSPVRVRRAALVLGLAVLAAASLPLVPETRTAALRAAVAPYVERLKSITDESSRVPFFRTGYMIGVLHPILGGGSESYGYRFDQYFEMPGGIYNRHPVHPLTPGSAHNVYLQTFAGKGLVGVALLLAIFAACFSAALPVLLRSTAVPEATRLGLLATTGSLVAFALYGVVQEIFYVPGLQLLFFSVVGMLAAQCHERARFGQRARRAFWAALALAFAAHLTYEYLYPGPVRVLGDEPTGFFVREADPSGQIFSWTTERAWVPVPPSAKAVTFQVRSVAPFRQQTEVKACGQRVVRLELTKQDWHPVPLPIPTQACQSLPYLEIRTVPAWVPGPDPRLLGVMVRNIEFR